MTSPPDVAWLRRLFNEITTQAECDPAFAERLRTAIFGDPLKPRGRRRRPGSLDPFEVFAQGEIAGLRAALSQLDIRQLKDIVSEHGMDRSKLALKWKTPARLIELIIETVVARARKGDAFRD